MGNRKWLVLITAGVLLVAGGAFIGGRYLQDNSHVPTAEERVQACIDKAMSKLDDVDDVELVVATKIKLQAACEARVG